MIGDCQQFAVSKRKGYMMEKETLTFLSEEEKEKALIELPDSAPAGTDDIDKWLDEINAQKQAIIDAPIVPKEETASDQPTGTEDQTKSSEEQKIENVRFEFSRDDLPDELKNYKDSDEIIKQFGHARKYANAVEKTLENQTEKISSLQEVLDLREKTLKERESIIEELKNRPIQQPVPKPQSTSDQDFTELNAKADDDYVSVAEMKRLVKGISRGSSSNSEIEKMIEENRKLRTDLDGYITDSKKLTEDNLQKQLVEAAMTGLEELQAKFPELKTSKSVASGSDSVEKDVSRFANRIILMKSGNSKPTWNQINAIVNSYLRNDAELTAYCQNNGITPESVGLKSDDLKAYALCANIDAAMKGTEIDPFTGDRRQLLNPLNRKPVNFPSYEAAYQHIKRESGISQQEVQDRVIEAEKRGQKTIEEAMSNRDASGKVLGNKGEASPENVGEEMTEEKARSIYLDTSISDKMEFEARKGNRTLFRLYNSASKRLGYGESSPDPLWPPEKKV